MSDRALQTPEPPDALRSSLGYTEEAVMRARGWATLFGAIAALSTFAPAAGAATTVGSVGTDAVADTNTGACPMGANCTFLGVALVGATPESVGVPGAPLMAVPASGVVVRWRIRTGSTPDDAQVALRVLRPAGGGAYTSAASSAPQALSSLGVRTFEARVPVRAGDALGLDDRSDALLFADDAGAAAQVWNPVLGVGAARAPTSTISGKRPLVAADIEPDADGDGYGDESQDACPANAQRQLVPCDPSIPVADLELTSLRWRPLPARAGEPIEIRATVRNNGPDAATGTVLRVRFPFTTRFLGTSPGTRCQRPAGRVDRTTLLCPIGTLRPGSSGLVTFSIEQGAAPSFDLTAAARSDVADPIVANSSATRRIPLAPAVNLKLGATDRRTYLVAGYPYIEDVRLDFTASERARATVRLRRGRAGLGERTYAVREGRRKFFRQFESGNVFGDLPAGRYSLRVQATDADGYRSRVQIVSFTVR